MKNLKYMQQCIIDNTLSQNPPTKNQPFKFRLNPGVLKYKILRYKLLIPFLDKDYHSPRCKSDIRKLLDLIQNSWISKEFVEIYQNTYEKVPRFTVSDGKKTFILEKTFNSTECYDFRMPGESFNLDTDFENCVVYAYKCPDDENFSPADYVDVVLEKLCMPGNDYCSNSCRESLSSYEINYKVHGDKYDNTYDLTSSRIAKILYNALCNIK